MRSLKIAAWASFLLVLFGFLAFQPEAALGKDKDKKGGGAKNVVVVKIMKHTHKVFVHAWKAAKKGGQGKEDLRAAYIRKMASRTALKHDKHALAARLSLKARALSRKVIQANKGELSKEDSTDSAEETQEASGATDAECDAAVAAEEATAPTADQILAEEPTPDTQE
jgi:hypothetical protein